MATPLAHRARVMEAMTIGSKVNEIEYVQHRTQ